VFRNIGEEYYYNWKRSEERARGLKIKRISLKCVGAMMAQC
jgi:hypothetical protein